MAKTAPKKSQMIRGTAFFPAEAEGFPSRSENPLPDGEGTLGVLLKKTRSRIGELRDTFVPRNPEFEPTLKFYSMMAEDPELEADLSTLMLREKVGVREAVNRYFDRYEAGLNRKDPYFSHRRYDAIDLRNLMVGLLGDSVILPSSPLPDQTVVMMDRLLVTLLLPLDFSKVVAVIARDGGSHSHAAIVLDSLRIPYFFDPEGILKIRPGDSVRIDVKQRLLWIGTKPAVVLPAPVSMPNSISEGNVRGHFQVFPCLSFPEEGLDMPLESVGGIGLVRSETLMLAQRRFPTQDEQIEAYMPLLRHMEGKPVYFRLLDIEPDKRPPAGYDGIYGAAFLLAYPEIAMTQLRVFVKLSLEYPLGIILPMVRHQTEIDGILAMVEEVRKEFPVSRFPLKIGTMVETVELANHIPTLHGVDFLTIGSNDLVCDLHQSCREDALYSPEWFQEPDFLETVRAILDQTTLPVFLCGEAANHPESANRLSDLGIHQFCPAPHCLGIYGGKPAGTGTVLRPNPPIPRRQ